MERFINRNEAGRQLAGRLQTYAGRTDVAVLALPRGGVPVGAEIADNLGAPLDIFIVRKLGVPGHEELAFGAIASGNVRVLNEEVLRKNPLSPEAIDAVVLREGEELSRREHLYRQEGQAVDITGKTVILVDDGLATGATMRAAVQALKEREPEKIIAAVPVAAPPPLRSLQAEVDEVVCPLVPTGFYAVGAWYEEFPQLTDDQVIRILQQNR